MSPLGPELSVRLAAAIYALLVFAGTWVLARHFAPRGAGSVLPVVLLVATPMMYLTIRYGRIEALSIAFSIWAIVAAAYRRPVATGILASSAVLTHPVCVWIGLPLLAFACVDRWNKRDFLLMIITTIPLSAAQLFWLIWNREGVRIFVDRFFVSDSVSNHGILASVVAEGARYIAYWNELSAVDWVIHAAFLVIPVLAGAFIALLDRRLLPLLIAAVSCFMVLAILVGSKNPYYLIQAMPVAFVLAEVAAERVPRAAVLIVCAGLIAWTGYQHMSSALAARTSHDVSYVVEELATRLPANETVIGPMIYAGLIRARPDIRFYSFHALSDTNDWALPPCDRINERIIERIGQDTRATSRKHELARTVTYVFHPMGPLPYLRLIYIGADREIAECMTVGEPLGEGLERPCEFKEQRGCGLPLIRRRQL